MKYSFLFLSKKILAILIITVWSFTIFAKEKNKTPLYEFRGVWIATAFNTDWPSSNKLTSAQQIEEFKKILDVVKASNFNAVVVQIRPMGDSFYPSQYYPWSSGLTGTSGKAPAPYYNPLKMMIEEAHKRNIEFHAWINPFRLASEHHLPNLAKNHPAIKFKSSVINYDKKIFFDPGRIEHRNFIIKGIMEIVKNYDIDAIHLDDYFYPYPNNKDVFNDKRTYNSSRTKLSLSDWRRDNINHFVENLSTEIKRAKPWVQFGISPWGVWRNKTSNTYGSNTKTSFTSYDCLYADTLLWVKSGWIDYITPQIYWHFKQKNCAYEEVLSFWRKELRQRSNVNLYVGHALYKLADPKTAKDWKPLEIPQQILYNRACKDVQGSCFYSISSLRKNPMNIQSNLMKHCYPNPALNPQMRWLKVATPKPVEILSAIRTSKNSAKITFRDKLNNTSIYYAIFRFKKEEVKYFSGATLIGTFKKQNKNTIQSFIDNKVSSSEEYLYYIFAVNRAHCLGPISNGFLMRK